MIAKILELILYIINFIITKILQLIALVFPSFGLSKLYTIFEAFFALMENGFKMTYFLFGESVFIFADIIILLFAVKHVAIPIINFIRKFFIK